MNFEICLNRNQHRDQLIPLRLFLKILGIVLVYLCLPVPGPFLCWTFNDHPSAIIIKNTSSKSGGWVSTSRTSSVLFMEAHSTASSAQGVGFLMSFTEWRCSSTLKLSMKFTISWNINIYIIYFPNKLFYYLSQISWGSLSLMQYFNFSLPNF